MPKKDGELMSDGRIVIETGLDTSGIEAGIGKMKSAVATGAKVAAAGIATASAALIGAGTAAITVGANFEEGMSQVAAISGATGNDLQALTDKAKEMGAKTKYSATESAEAFSYMAMAGWKTEDMLGGIEGVMNLAAASGEDLASVSDIVTDAITAFGLSANDSTHFADVLAAASSNANTNVGMLGESFKYVAPIAGAMNYSVEDVSTALGLMANASVKGSMAGTSLKTALANMAAPTDAMAAVMEQYGISLENTDGSMKSLGEVIETLRENMGSLSETEQTAAASTLFGKEAMAGMLAIINASPADYEKLTSAINNADGASAQMAETMQDNLKGSVTILKSSLEGLGIEIYESMEEPLKGAADTAIEYVNQVTEAFKSGGLEGAVEAAGDIFADLAVRAAEAAPDMIDAAVSVIEAFIKGLVKNKARLGKTALDIAVTLANGLIKFLPKQMQKPAQDAVKSLSKSLTSGGLKNAIDTVCRFFDNIIKVIGSISNTVFPAFTSALDFAGDHLDILAGAATAVVVAFAAWKVVSGIANTISSVNAVAKAGQVALAAYATQNGIAAISSATASGAMTVQQTVCAGLTGAIGRATAAQNLWNLALNANIIGIVITAIAALAAGIGIFTMATEDSAESTAILTEEQQALADSASEAAEKYAELEEARKERLAGIDAEYSNTQALADELSTIVDENGRIKEGYEERANIITGLLSQALGTEIEITEGVIQNYRELKKSIDEVIRSKKAEAVQSSMQEDYAAALKDQTKRYQEYANAQKDAAENSKALAEAETEWAKIKEKRDASAGDERAYMAYNDELKKAAQNVELLSGRQEALDKTLADNESAYVKCATTIQNYEGITGAIVSGDAEQIDKALAMATYSFQTAETGTKTSLANQVTTLRESYNTMKEAVASGAPGVTQATVEELYGLYTAAQAEYGKLSGMSVEEINGWTELSNNAFTSSNTPEVAKQKMEETIESIINPFGVGAPQVSKAASELVDSANTGIETSDTTSAAQNSMSQTGDTMADTLVEAKPKVENAAKETMSGYTSGVESSAGDAEEAGTTVSESSVKGLDSISGTEPGEKKGQQYISGMDSKGTDAYNSGKSLGTNAHRGLGSVKGNGVGEDFAQGYIDGMSSKGSEVQKAAANLAQKALDAVKNTQASASPSKKTKKLAKDFADGYTGEMKARVKDVKKSASALASAALKELLKANGNYEEAGKQAVEHYESGMEKVVKSSENKVEKLLDKEVNKAIQARKKEVKKKNEALRKTITEENKKNVEAQIKENSKNLKTYKDNYKKLGKAALKAYQDALEDEAKRVKESLSDTIDEITKEYQDKYDDVIRLRDSMSGKLSNTDLFEKNEDGIILTNLKDEIVAIAKYDANLTKLKGRISNDLLAEIADMNREDALAYTEALLAMSENELAQYSALYDKKNADAKAVAQKFYQEQLNTIQTEFTGKINAAFASAQKEMESIGKNVAQGFIKGLKSQSKSMAAAVKSISKTIIKQVKKDFGIKSPSKEFEAIAGYCTEGYENQYEKGMEQAKKTVSRTGKGMLETARKSLDYSALAAKMRAGIQSVNARVGESLGATVNYKVSGTAQIEAANADRERAKLADEIVDAFARSGIGVKVGSREFGRLIREVM